MWLSILALLTALSISSVSAYFSVIGLTAIFAAAKIPIIILGTTLEIGKIVTTFLLHRNWKILSWKLKSYLIPAIIILMMITSMGTFGFLSKAHLDQGLPSDNIAAQMSIVDTKISAAQSDLIASKANLAQLDQVVNELMSRTTNATGANRANNVRKNQKTDRDQLNAQIVKDQTDLISLQQEKAPLMEQQNKLAVEVGPIKYIAALIYGNNPSANSLENAVRLVILLLVGVFDPLAIVLLLAASSSIPKKREVEEAEIEIQPIQTHSMPRTIAVIQKEEPTIPTVTVEQKVEIIPPLTEEPMPFETTNANMEQLQIELNNAKTMLNNTLVNARLKSEEVEKLKVEKNDLLNKMVEYEKKVNDLHKINGEVIEQLTDAHNNKRSAELAVTSLNEKLIEHSDNLQKILVDHDETVNELKTELTTTQTTNGELENSLNTHKNLVADLQEKLDALTTADKVATRLMNQEVEITNVPKIVSNNFGVNFPPDPIAQQKFMVTDLFPNKYFVWNGANWVELDKNSNLEYLLDVHYLQFLIEQISIGVCDFDKLSDIEQFAVTEALTKN